MSTIDAVVLAFGAAVLLALMARRLEIPYPSVLVLGGLVLALVPGVPLLTIEPSIVLSVFLPTILFVESGRTQWRQLGREALAPLAIGLCLVAGSCAVVAVVAMVLFPGIPPAVAIVLGAILAPVDSTASAAILGHLRVPQEILTALAREGLVNDTAAVLVYKLAVAAVLGSVSSWPVAAGGFALAATGGVAFGVAVGWLGGRLLRLSIDHVTYSLLSLSLAFAAYVAADALGLSGVLATVAAGLVCRPAVGAIPAALRLDADTVFEVVLFGLNAFGFFLVGAQLPTVRADLGFYTVGELSFYALSVSVTLLAARLLIALAVAMPVGRGNARSWRHALVTGWSGMRGLVSLAAALGLPRTGEGSVFPYRDLAVFLAFATILFTLVVQGLSLAGLVRRLGAGDGEAAAERGWP